MASIRRETLIQARPEEVWAAIREVGAVQSIFPGIVSESHLDGDARVINFVNGMVVRERIVTIDDEARRLAYAAFGGRTSHHNASMQVFADGHQSRLVWITDLLPDEMEGLITGLMEQGSAVMKQTLEATAPPASS